MWIILLGLVGGGVSACVVSAALRLNRPFSALKGVLWAVLAVGFVCLAAIVLGYYWLRIYVNGRYEANDVLIRLFVVVPMTVGATIGAAGAVFGIASRKCHHS
jgi:hypothetical protein